MSDAQSMIDEILDGLLDGVDTIIEERCMPQPSTVEKARFTAKKPTGAAAYRKKRVDGVLWEAPSGAVIRVRKLDITDQVVLNKFPDHLQKYMLGEMEGSALLAAADDGDKGDEGQASRSPAGETREALALMYELSVTCCKLGWIEPRVVDEVTNPDEEISVEELEGEDRMAFVEYAFDGFQREGRQLRSFRDEQGGGVEAGSAVQEVQPAPEHGAAAHAVGD